MVWRCPPLHLPNWNHLWKWKTDMTTYEQWQMLFNQKLKEVMHSSNKYYEYATMSPTANGSCARELIAEEYYSQQTEIEELKKKIEISKRDYSFMKSLAIGEETRAKDLEKELKRTKFAWNLAENLLEEYRDDNRTSESFDRTASHMAGEYVAHPVELTDEEILQVYSESEIWVPDMDENDLIEFAKAILRKAQLTCNGFCGEYECKENKEGCKRNDN